MKNNFFRQLVSLMLVVCLFGMNILTGDITVSANSQNDKTVINVTEFGADPSGYTDSAEAIQAAIEAAKEIDGPVILNFPLGEYHIYPDYSQERELYISNTVGSDQNYKNKKIGILLENMNDVTLEGNDSLFVFHGKMMSFAAIDCENVVFQNFSFDFQVPTVVDITVESLGNDGLDYSICYIPECYNYEISGTSIKWMSDKSPYTENYYWTETNSISYTQIHNWKSGETWRSGNALFSNISSIEDLGNNRVKINYNNRSGDIKEGYCYQMRKTVRDHSGVLFWQSKDIVMQNINAHFLHGFGIVGQFSENITIDNTNFKVPENSGRSTAGYADFIQMSGCKGLISITNSNFENAHDDPINIHGTFLQVAERLAANQFVVQYKHNETAGFPNFYVGDQVEFMTRGNMLPVDNGTATVIDVQGPGGALNDLTKIIITLDKDMPSEIMANTHVVENITYTPSVEIKNNTFSAIPTRGILVTTRQPIVIEDNYFSKMNMSGIYISNDAASWYESGPVKDVIIRNNVFDECGSPVIYFEPTNSTVNAERPVHENVLIENNIFNIKNGNVLGAKSVGNLSFINNTINRFESSVQLSIESELTELTVGESIVLDTNAAGTSLGTQLFWFNGCKDVHLSGNSYDGGLNMRASISNMPSDYITLDKMENITIGSDNKGDPVGDILYASSDEKVLTVTKDGSILAIGSGEATISAFTVLNGKLFESNAIDFIVKGDTQLHLPEKVSIASDSDTLTAKGQTIDFSASVVPTTANNTIVWSLADAATGLSTECAAITQGGKLTAVSSGIVEVFARTVNGLQASKLIKIHIEEETGKLGSLWSIVRNADNHWNFVEGNDAIEIRAQAGSLWASGNNVSNIILYKLKETDEVTATVKVSGKTQSGWDEAGLIFYTDDDNYVAVQRKHAGGNPTVRMVTESSGNANEDLYKPNPAVNDLFYKLVKSGNNITGYYSEDSENWFEIGTVTNSSLNNQLSVGIIAAGGTATNTPFVFSELNVNNEFISFMENNNPPVISNMVYDKSLISESETLAVNYEFNDPDGHLEGDTIIRWAYAEQINGDYQLIDNLYGAEITVPTGFKGHYIKAIIIPVDEYGQAGNITYGTGLFIEEGIAKVGLSALIPNSTALTVNEVFRSDLTEYTLIVPYMISSGMFRLRANSPQQKITVSDGSKNSYEFTGEGTVQADLTGNEILIHVKDNNGDELTYRIKIIHLLSSESRLETIRFSGLDFEPFTTDERFYLTAVDTEVDHTFVSWSAKSPASSVQITANGKLLPASFAKSDKEAKIPLLSGANVIEVKVAAADGTSFTYYRFIAMRKGDRNTDIAELKINGNPLAEFDPSIYEYNITHHGLAELNLYAKTQSSKSVISITNNGKYFQTNELDITLHPGENTVIVGVKPETSGVGSYYIFNINYEKTEITDKTKLKELYDIAISLRKEEYTANSWLTFEIMLDNANNVLADENAATEQIKTAYDQLYQAMIDLEKSNINKSRLKAAIELAETYLPKEEWEKYVDRGKAEFLAALELAREVFNVNTSDQDAIDEAANHLTKAITALRYRADKQLLAENYSRVLSEIERLNLDDYTDESVVSLNNLLSAVKIMLDDESLSEDDQTDIDSMAIQLDTAIDLLEEKNTDSSEKTDTDDTDADDTDEETEPTDSETSSSDPRQNETNNKINESDNERLVKNKVKTGDKNTLLLSLTLSVLAIMAFLIAVKKRNTKKVLNN